MLRTAVNDARRSRLAELLWPTDPRSFAAGFPETGEDHDVFLEAVDRQDFNWLVFVVAASGFLTDSYNLFASNVILPAIAYIYWDGQEALNNQLTFNILTLAASALGQVVFGAAADAYGRKALYGIELIIVIISTIGLLQCSQGFVDPLDPTHHTWKITGWLMFWRCIMGFGIGAEYPLSACIAAEWSSKKSRGRLMAAVFLMQPIGQLCAYGAGLTALNFVKGYGKVEIDTLWRYVIGIGAVPTLLALAFRLYMPESGRYYYDVTRNYERRRNTDNTGGTDGTMSRDIADVPNEKSDIYKGTFKQFHVTELREYLFNERQNWVTLVGTCMCWFLLDIAFYGLGFNSPGTLAKLWATGPMEFPMNTPSWLSQSDIQPDTYNSTFTVTITDGSTADIPWNGIYPANVLKTPLIREVLYNNMTHAIYTVCLAAIAGSILFIALVNRQDRKTMLTSTFLILAAILFTACGAWPSLFHQEGTHVVLIAFWIVISFLFNFGPNTLTFMIPAEVFPTKYRCTFYGLSAASGKVGSVIAQGTNSTNFRWLLLAFAISMVCGAGFSYFCLPHVQRRSEQPPHAFENLSLETLAQGRDPLETLRRRKAPDVESRDPDAGIHMADQDSTLMARRGSMF